MWSLASRSGRGKPDDEAPAGAARGSFDVTARCAREAPSEREPEASAIAAAVWIRCAAAPGLEDRVAIVCVNTRTVVGDREQDGAVVALDRHRYPALTV